MYNAKSNCKMLVQQYPLYCILSIFVCYAGWDVGCSGSTSGGNTAVGCVTSGCCQWNLHVTSSGLCDGANEVCCYSDVLPGCSIIGEPSGEYHILLFGIF